MNIIPVALGLAAGVGLYASVVHIIVGLSRRPRELTHLAFALASIFVAGNLLAILAIHTAGSVAEYIVSFKFGFGLSALLFIYALLWFVALFTAVVPRRFFLVMSFWFAVIVVLHLMLPFGILFAEIVDLRNITLPWGEQVVLHQQAPPHPWRLVVDLFLLTMFGFFFYAIYRQFRAGRRQRAILLFLAILIMFLADRFDTLVDLEVISSIYISGFAFLAIMIVMSITLSRELAQNETELRGYRTHLEWLVNERTAALNQANEDLAQEVRERRQAEQILGHRVAELGILHQTAQVVASMIDLPTTLQTLSEKISELFAARYTYVIVPEPDGAGLQLVVGFEQGVGLLEPTPLNTALTELPLAKEVLQTGQSLAVSNILSRPWPPSIRAFLTGHQVQSLMIVPLISRGSSIGLMSVASDQVGREFTPEELKLAETIATDVAAAVENMRAVEQEKNAAAAEERRRLARDLHDEVTQTIYSASLIVEALPGLWQRDPDEGSRNLVKLRQLVRGALAEMRTLLFELRPSAVAGANLGTLLQQLGDVLTGRTRIPVEVALEGDIKIPPQVKIVYYRIAQEAFNNIAKHAGATRVSARLQQLSDRAVLSIQDNGRGFDPATVSKDHMGLQIMHERADEIGASLSLESEPGRGSQVSVIWVRPAAGRTGFAGPQDKGELTSEPARVNTIFPEDPSIALE
jgi:signal transduction histidine kinase